MKVFETVFVSSDGRIRAGWRLLIQIVLSLIFLIPLSLLASQVGGRNLQIVAGGIAITLGVWVSGWMVDKRPIRDFGLRITAGWWKECGIGFLMATLVMSVMVLILWMAGWIEFAGYGWERNSARGFMAVFGGYLITMAVVGFYEELWSRGYQLKNLTEGFFTGYNRNSAGIIAIGISSLVFGVLHMSNPNATMFGMVTIVLAGIMLAIPYVVTGQLGYSVGIHFGWNFIQGGVYGLPVSGIPFRQSLLQAQVTGPDLWTGGRFGPEGGIIGIIGVVLLVVVIVLWLRHQGHTLSVSPNITHPPDSGRY
ncbi:type II CAAX endopeptidase family protein [Balneolales bacterium ANBcel1]|nr:type II CAAX endopeptidase family protein [Balneolales bacterium ANBcel1]